ncbi:hypothetical protein [Halomicrococcus gelatinilyticus]|uniref:hypothetical protein n=1 Tax=Halomicrococcus gelatinilyticus TaxID=1702103 RepID=UPI002E105D77
MTWRRRGAVVALALVALTLERLGAAVERTVPFSPLFARWRVGADYLDRYGVETGEALPGEMDDVAAYASDAFDPDALDPTVREFYERTASYDLDYAVRWHRGFRLGATLAVRLTGRIEQLDLPAPGKAGGRLRSRIVAVGERSDPRDGARAWIRTDEAGTAVFVAIYASHVSDGRRYVNIAVPLPRSNLSTVLLPRTTPGGGVELTTRAGTDDEGLYLVTPLGAVALPLSQRFRVWSDGGGVRATHEMWAFGRQFLTVTYAARPDQG